MNEINLSKFECLDGFLVSLSPEVIDYDKVNEEQAISGIVKRNNALSILQTLEEGRLILEMDPFPWKWVQEQCQSLVYDEKNKKWVEDSLLYKKWLTNILNMLENEAKKQGKI